MKIPVSVFMITKDEQDRISTAIASVFGWVDEIIVIDSGSQDKTCEYAKSAGADNVLYHKWEGYGQQKRFAEDQCKNQWLLNIDADEEISSQLRDEIISLFSSGSPPYPAYIFRILNMLPFEKKPSLLAGRKTPIRLYDKNAARFRNDAVHDSVIFHENTKTNRTRKLNGIVYHRSFRGLGHMIQKNLSYAEMQAEKMVEEGKIPSVMRIFAEPFLAFSKMYVLRGFFIYGAYGFVIAVLHMTSRVYRLSRAREMLIHKDTESIK